MLVVTRNKLTLACLIAIILSGCKMSRDLDHWRAPIETQQASVAPYMDLASRQSIRPTALSRKAVARPATPKDLQNAPRWTMTIDEVIHMALNSDYVLRSLGGQVVSQPDNARASIDPALIQTNARVGEQAALSEFDAQVRSSLTWTRADRGLKRQILLSDATAIDSLFASADSVVEKRTRSGTTFGFRTTLDYDRDNLGIPPNRFASAYDNSVGLEIRHPLARGGGREYNEIAGPGARAGEYRGIVIAQINTNIAVHDFRIALRDHLHDVVRTYWGLYLSYVDLEAKQRSLDIARETLRVARQKRDEGLVDADQVYQAEERFHAAEVAYIDSVSGSPNRSILGILGVSGSQLAGVEVGVLALERRLRYQLGLPPSDGRLIRPADAPSAARMVFGWEQALATAVTKRPELMRQSHVVHKKRQELRAARNFLLPRLDAIAQYRYRGFGDNYFKDGAEDSGAFNELFNGDLQEWVAGVEFEWPAGNRIGQEAVRNARLSLARELGILEQQQYQIGHELASAFSEIDRAFEARAAAESRYQAAVRHQQATAEKFASGIPINVETVLDAQRRASDARAAFDVAQVDCEIAILKVNVAKATFLNQCNIAVHSNQAMPVIESSISMPLHDASEQVDVPKFKTDEVKEANEVKEAIELQESDVKPKALPSATKPDVSMEQPLFDPDNPPFSVPLNEPEMDRYRDARESGSPSFEMPIEVPIKPASPVSRPLPRELGKPSYSSTPSATPSSPRYGSTTQTQFSPASGRLNVPQGASQVPMAPATWNLQPARGSNPGDFSQPSWQAPSITPGKGFNEDRSYFGPSS